MNAKNTLIVFYALIFVACGPRFHISSPVPDDAQSTAVKSKAVSHAQPQDAQPQDAPPPLQRQSADLSPASTPDGVAAQTAENSQATKIKLQNQSEQNVSMSGRSSHAGSGEQPLTHESTDQRSTSDKLNPADEAGSLLIAGSNDNQANSGVVAQPYDSDKVCGSKSFEDQFNKTALSEIAGKVLSAQSQKLFRKNCFSAGWFTYPIEQIIFLLNQKETDSLSTGFFGSPESVKLHFLNTFIADLGRWNDPQVQKKWALELSLLNESSYVVAGDPLVTDGKTHFNGYASLVGDVYSAQPNDGAPKK